MLRTDRQRDVEEHNVEETQKVVVTRSAGQREFTGAHGSLSPAAMQRTYETKQHDLQMQLGTDALKV